ncbi:MAG TPA: LCP family protein [Anaerolineae bacterium]|nr:LCP family protein [Anaerolineae bacterium]
MPDQPVWSSQPDPPAKPADTQPSSSINGPTAARRPTASRRPLGLYLFTGCLAVIVLLCVTASLVLAAIGPSTLLALRDRWLGRNLGETVTTLGQMAQVIVTNNDADIWPAPDGGRVTIVLMGTDTRDRAAEGASRSDVMMLVTIDPISQTAAMLSIPRDLYVPLPGFDQQRINTAYFWGDYNQLPGGGPQLAMDIIEYNFGIPVDRYGVIDFNGFKQVIDAIDGLDLDVPREIIDYEYPTEDYGIETRIIPAGRVHMDGALALKYVRTRHADSDFGRLQRQQQVLLAVRDKALSIGQLGKVPEVLNVVGDSLRTDLTLPEILSLAKKWTQIPRENIHAYRIDETMITPWVTPQGGQVLLPDRAKIAQMVAQFLGQ